MIFFRFLSSRTHKGVKALSTTLVSLFILLTGVLLIQPRLGQRRLLLHDRHLLTPMEVEELPKGTLAVVLDRRLGQDERSFYYRLLRLVMERSGQPFVLGYSTEVLPQDEAMNALASGHVNGDQNPTGITVGAYGAGLELNRRLLPIKIPLKGGLMGLRAGWTNRSNHPQLRQVSDLDELRALVLLQGLGWSDVDIFDRAGLRTFTAAPQERLRLVDNERVHLFPRGIAELEWEAPEVRRTSSDLELDEHLLITYPFAGFFYVSRSNPSLAKAISTGFERVIAEGSYQRLLEEVVFTPWLRRHLKLHKRRVIHLRNPAAGFVFEGVDPRYWIVPWRALDQKRFTQGLQLCALPRLKLLCQ